MQFSVMQWADFVFYFVENIIEQQSDEQFC